MSNEFSSPDEPNEAEQLLANAFEEKTVLFKTIEFFDESRQRHLETYSQFLKKPTLENRNNIAQAGNHTITAFSRSIDVICGEFDDPDAKVTAIVALIVKEDSERMQYLRDLDSNNLYDSYEEEGGIDTLKDTIQNVLENEDISPIERKKIICSLLASDIQEKLNTFAPATAIKVNSHIITQVVAHTIETAKISAGVAGGIVLGGLALRKLFNR